MPSLISQQDLRSVRNLSFCYLCGHGWDERPVDHDHVPPKSLFDEKDRDRPLKLKTHKDCNNRHSDSSDKLMSQFIALLEGRPKKLDRLRLSSHEVGSDSPIVAVEWFPFRQIVARFLKGFHAALYWEYLQDGHMLLVHEPFPGGERPGQDTILYPEQREAFATEIKANRMAGTIDTVLTYNGKCRYECVWSELDDGRPICIFALDIYHWDKHVDPNRYPERGCVGFYAAPNGNVPDRATRKTRIIFPISYREPFNPFEEISHH